MPTDSAPPPFDLNLAREAFDNAAGLHEAATRGAAPNLRAEHLDRLRAADAAFTAALADGRVSDAITADDDFHQVFLEVAGDPDLQVSVDLLGPRLRRMDLWIFTRKSFGAGANTHPGIIAALEQGDVETAAGLVEASYRDAGEQLAAALAREGK